MDFKPNCPIELTSHYIGNKWKPIILYHLFEKKVMRFSELQRALPTISQKVLTDNLRGLETDDLLHREIYPQVPVKVEYSLTSKGLGLKEIVYAMHQWGLQQ